MRSKPSSIQERTVASSAENGAPLQGESIHEEIAKLAYALWEARGGNGGSAEEDWYRAEQEIRSRS